ncbi:MAG: ASCH domain-containing protein [Parcubacteria group bacterium]|nr:ASCH domain-containing protein [Parcubacteria group bacterium]
MTEMKRLIFGEGLMSPTLTGDKQITLRKYRTGSHDFVKGEVIRGEFKDGLNILLQVTADTEKKPFSELTNEEARADGFEDAEAAFNGLKDYYPDLQKSDLSATIRYKIVEVDGTSAVSINEYAQ